jgi:hypothetical protein
MSHSRKSNHPSLEMLLDHAEGLLSGSEAEAVARHLEECPLCRLEMRRRDDFAAADDAERLARAQWDQAELQLQRAWREGIQPELEEERGQHSPTAPPPRHGFSGRKWLWVPAAAAAALVFALFPPGNLPLIGYQDGQETPSEGPGLNRGPTAVVRGSGEVADPTIFLVGPVGPQTDRPVDFIWQTETDCQNFTLEIFTADLNLVFRQTEIPVEEPRDGQVHSFVAPDSLMVKLTGGQTYLWSVQGFQQNQQVAESDNGWFNME